MNRIGRVSDIGNGGARVTLEDMDNVVSDWLPINSMKSVNCTLNGKCETMLDISIGDLVEVCFYNENLKDGAIVAKAR